MAYLKLDIVLFLPSNWNKVRFLHRHCKNDSLAHFSRIQLILWDLISNSVIVHWVLKCHWNAFCIGGRVVFLCFFEKAKVFFGRSSFIFFF